MINKSPVSTTLRAGTGVKIGPRCEVSGDVRLADHVRVGEHAVLNGEIDIGRRSNLNGYNELHGKVDVGRYCAIAPRATFRQHNHVTHNPSLQGAFYRDVLDDQLSSTADGPIEIGNDVWLGARAMVLSGVTIGDGAVVGAGSIVTSDVEPYSVVAGVPATHKKWRFRESIREELLDLEWWNWSEADMKSNEAFFRTDLTEVETVYEVVEERPHSR